MLIYVYFYHCSYSRDDYDIFVFISSKLTIIIDICDLIIIKRHLMKMFTIIS